MLGAAGGWRGGGSVVESVPEVVRVVLEAANRGDVDAFLDAFGAGGVVDDWGREFAGRDAIRRWSDAEFIGKQVTLAVTGVERDGDRTVVGAKVGGNGFNGPSHFGFDVDGAKVTRMTIRA
jgi:hypothetical protein